ncbi:MAG: hypothetical protein WBD30_15780 [Bacteroidota bacterium]
MYLLILLSVLLWPDVACAGESWLCSITSAVECADGEPCGEPDLGGLAPPTFLRVDAVKKKITLLAPDSRRGETTEIGTVRETEDIWVFTGVERGRAWSMVISREGHMTLSVTYDGVTWTVFGNCMLER